MLHQNWSTLHRSSGLRDISFIAEEARAGELSRLIANTTEPQSIQLIRCVRFGWARKLWSAAGASLSILGGFGSWTEPPGRRPVFEFL
jgi:hypothetical protein